ncbi:hypothetical protein COO60DRAFT_1463577 [Scenedesmus sp. NREL 46B-D3]|nr:hypothetical protein COO60DRAFT_1463577 [Scenedesmus sp. NREL 46B-D3]
MSTSNSNSNRLRQALQVVARHELDTPNAVRLISRDLGRNMGSMLTAGRNERPKRAVATLLHDTWLRRMRGFAEATCIVGATTVKIAADGSMTRSSPGAEEAGVVSVDASGLVRWAWPTQFLLGARNAVWQVRPYDHRNDAVIRFNVEFHGATVPSTHDVLWVHNAYQQRLLNQAEFTCTRRLIRTSCKITMQPLEHMHGRKSCDEVHEDVRGLLGQWLAQRVYYCYPGVLPEANSAILVLENVPLSQQIARASSNAAKRLVDNGFAVTMQLYDKLR